MELRYLTTQWSHVCDEHFKILQGSVVTLFRRGGKCLHNFAANIFGKLRTKFHQICPIFIEDIAKKHFGLSFPGHSVHVYS